MQNINPLLSIGDHLITRRVGYTHHGLYLGDGNVLEYILHEGIIIVSLERFSDGNEIFIREHKNARFPGIKAVQRGMMRLGENNYNLLTRNCEHFVNWCIDGVESSRQVDNIILTIIPFYSIFKNSNFLRGCLKLVFDDPNSLDQAFARINTSNRRARDPILRAKELSEDILGSTQNDIVSIASIFTTASQLSKEYTDWAKEKRLGDNNLLKSSLDLSAAAIDNLNTKLGVSFYTKSNFTYNQESVDALVFNRSKNKFQSVKDSIKLIKQVNEFLNINNKFNEDDAFLQRDKDLAYNASYSSPAYFKEDKYQKDNNLLQEILNDLNNNESIKAKTKYIASTGARTIGQTLNKIDQLVSKHQQIKQSFINASDYFQNQAQKQDKPHSSTYYASSLAPSRLKGINSSPLRGSNLNKANLDGTKSTNYSHSAGANTCFNDLNRKSALPPSWESKLPKIHISIDPEVFANAINSVNQTILESALARHALSAKRAQVNNKDHYSLNDMAIDIINELKEELKEELKKRSQA